MRIQAIKEEIRKLTRPEQVEIYLNQSHLAEDLILKPNLDWIEHIENFCDESSEAVEEYLTYETGIEESVWQEPDLQE